MGGGGCVGWGNDFLNAAVKSPRPKVWGNNMHHFIVLLVYKKHYISSSQKPRLAQPTHATCEERMCKQEWCLAHMSEVSSV